MAHSKEVIVVGAGIVGASIAWHLASIGARVSIFDTDGGGGTATPNSFAWVNATWGSPEPYFRLRTRSMEEWKRLSTAVPDIPIAWPGGLRWDMGPAELEAFTRNHASWGYGIRLVDRSEIARIEPALAGPPELAAFAAREGMVEPAAAARALLADAERLGARFITGTRVTSLLSQGSRVTGVRTDGDRFTADQTVLAAGVATAELAATAGLTVPLKAPPGLLVHSKPYRRILNGLVLAEKLHMRQTTDGRLVAGADFGGTEPGVDPAVTARHVFEDMRSMLNEADDLEFDFYSIGYRPTPKDGFPVIGAAEGLNGLYVAVMHSGITLAPAVGLFTAEEILTGRRDPLLEPYGFRSL